MSNTNQAYHKAKLLKNDEFYTRYEDIEREVSKYREFLNDKTIYCNADTPDSQFVQFFKDKFWDYQLKSLMATFPGLPAFEYFGVGCQHTDLPDNFDTHFIPKGSFESEGVLPYLRRADVIITNPPFSKIRQFIRLLMNNDKQFLIIAPYTLVTYRDVAKNIREGKLRTGYSHKAIAFDTPTGESRLNNVFWLTTFPVNKKLELGDHEPPELEKLDNANAYRITNIKHISKHDRRVLCVNNNFIVQAGRQQYKIVGFRRGEDGRDFRFNGKNIFAHWLIQLEDNNV